MYISELIRIIDKHDVYGIHRINATKVIYVFFLLSVTNSLFTLPHPYFYFFYLPLTAIAAEIATNNIKDKYWIYISTVFFTSLAILTLNAFNSYPLAFYLIVFIMSAFLYSFALEKNKKMLPFIPVILSLASYSLLYPTLNSSFRLMLENLSLTFLSLIIILAGILLFPLSYYYRAWLRAFLLCCKDILTALESMHTGKELEHSIRQTNLSYMLTFSKMLPYKFPTFTVLKINLLTQDLYYKCLFDASRDKNHFLSLKQDVTLLVHAIRSEKKCILKSCEEPTLNKLVLAWNRLC